jgi:Xaa-Pro aminopeptidase
LYGFYLGVYEAILYSIKGGLTAAQVNENALAKIEQLLANAKFSKPIYTEAATRYVNSFRAMAKSGRGGLGHAVGMATHDFGSGSGLLRPGMVFTIEPQFVIAQEQIYIRLEDMIVITEGGATILSDFVPRSIAAVEKAVAEPGLLQQYGRIR